MCFFSVSLSPPEFHANHRRISLQAPRSHQLPSATFCHSLSEGRYLNIQLLQKVWPSCPPERPNVENISPAQIQTCILMFVIFLPVFLSPLCIFVSLVCLNCLVLHSASLELHKILSLSFCLSHHLSSKLNRV